MAFEKGQIAWNKGMSNTWVLGAKNPRWAGGVTRAESYKKYRESNREKVRKWGRDFQQRSKTDPTRMLKMNLRRRLLKVLGKKKDRNSSIEFLGCSVNELKFHLEGKFKDGMSWENHGTFGWHIDHIIPITFYDLKDSVQVKQAFHYSNLQPLWALENIKKSNKIYA